MTDTSTLLAEGVDIADEDARQTYYLLRLEGLEPDAARYRATHSTNGNRFDNATGGPWINPDFRDSDLKSLTQDNRTNDERDQSIEDSEAVDRALRALPAEYESLLIFRYGLQNTTPLQIGELAKLHGLSIPTTERRLRKAREAIREELTP